MRQRCMHDYDLAHSEPEMHAVSVIWQVVYEKRNQ